MMPRYSQWCNLMLLLPLLFHLVMATESIEDWQANYLWIVHEEDVTKWWDPLYVYHLVYPLQSLSPSEKRQQFTELVKAVLANGNRNDKKFISNALVIDHERIGQFLPDTSFEALLKLPGLDFQGPPELWEGVSIEEALTAVEAFMSKPFHPSVMKRLGASGFGIASMNLNQGDLTFFEMLMDLTEGRPKVAELLSLYKDPLLVAIVQCQERLHDPVCVGELRFTGANYFAAVWNVVLEPRLFPPNVYSEVNTAIGALLEFRKALDSMDPPMEIVTFHDDGKYAVPFMWDQHQNQLQIALLEQEAALTMVRQRAPLKQFVPCRDKPLRHE